MPSNRIDATLTDAQRDQAKAALAALAEALPFLIDLSPRARADSPRLGEKNRSSVSLSRLLPHSTRVCAVGQHQFTFTSCVGVGLAAPLEAGGQQQGGGEQKTVVCPRCRLSLLT